MKTAQLNGQEITVNEAIAHNAATKQRGYLYDCCACGGKARVHNHSHRGNDGHFEHQNRDRECELMYKG